MEKTKEVKELESADTREWAANIVDARFEKVVNLCEAAMNPDDIEGVHAMRVATRRLRSALRGFSPLLKEKSLKKVNQDLKKLANVLGLARDHDVAIVALRKLQKEAEREQIIQGLERLIEERCLQRERVQITLTQALEVAVIKDLQTRFKAALKEAIEKRQVQVLSLNEAGRDVVLTSLREFCDLSGSLYEPFNPKQLHQLRIAAKRLRYLLELFVECWGEKIVPFIEAITEMQTSLGEVHDANVWIKDFSHRLRKNKEALENDEFQTAAWILSEFAKKWTRNYRAALRLWRAWKENAFVERLRITVSQNAV